MVALYQDRTYNVDSLSGQVEALKHTVQQQNQDLRIYQRNETLLKEKLTERLHTFGVEKPVATLPYYEMATRPEPLSADFHTSPVKSMTFGNNMIISSPIIHSDRSTPRRHSIENFEDRAGVKSKRDCTIDCVFSLNG
jgi:hypothetical protein